MNFSFIQITDHHLVESETALISGFLPAYAFRAVMRHIAQNVGNHADFLISTGDLVERPSEGAYRMLRQMLQMRNGMCETPGPLLISMEGLQDFPMYLLPGNDDDRSNCPNRTFG
jgi:3',5'-cyclic AMP phosphodiesterase CpdA